ETGAGLPQVEVALWPLEGRNMKFSRHRGSALNVPWMREPRRTTTAADGSFVFEHLPARGFHPYNFGTPDRAGSVDQWLGQLIVTTPEHALATEKLLLAADESQSQVQVTCWPRATVAGRVIDSHGEPIAG